jgi:hypothetical protein
MRENWHSDRVFDSHENIVDYCRDARRNLQRQPWRIMKIGSSSIDRLALQTRLGEIAKALPEASSEFVHGRTNYLRQSGQD